MREAGLTIIKYKIAINVGSRIVLRSTDYEAEHYERPGKQRIYIRDIRVPDVRGTLVIFVRFV